MNSDSGQRSSVRVLPSLSVAGKEMRSMMNRRKKVVFAVFFATVFCASAQEYPHFQASLTPDYALYESSQRIEGLTLSVWGHNPQSGLAIGLVNGSIENSSGLSLGVLNYAESYAGVQWALANFTEGDFAGWQGGPLLGLLVSVVNHTGGHMSGVQAGVVNLAGTLSGLQLGLINYARQAESGVQIGLVNLLPQNSAWFTGMPQELAPGMVLVNWRF